MIFHQVFAAVIKADQLLDGFSLIGKSHLRLAGLNALGNGFIAIGFLRLEFDTPQISAGDDMGHHQPQCDLRGL